MPDTDFSTTDREVNMRDEDLHVTYILIRVEGFHY